MVAAESAPLRKAFASRLHDGLDYQTALFRLPVNGFTTVAVSTTIKDMPAQASDQIPLLPMVMEGDIYFHAAGRYQAARLKIKKELMNHQGEGTKYVFESTYSEDLKVEK